jgi:4'-phosphopantetheinyl transferase
MSWCFTQSGGHAVQGRTPRDLRAVFASASGQSGLTFPHAIVVVLAEPREWQPWLGEALTILSTDEAERVRRRRIAGDREALAIAYALHRLLLGHAMDMDPKDVPLFRDAEGCPRLVGDVAYTSLSHADGLIALAVTKMGPVGIDIEPAVRACVMAEIAGRVQQPGDAAELSALPEPARGRALLEMWVRKEAVLKAAGVGLAVPMETFAAPEHPRLIVPGLCVEPTQIRMLQAGAHCVAAIAGPSGVVIECQWLRPGAASHANQNSCCALGGTYHIQSELAPVS